MYGITQDQIDRLKRAEAETDAARQDISKTFLAHYGIKKGDLVEDTSTGLHYRIDWASVSLSRTDEPHVHVSGRRVWKSGRKAGREAHSTSFLIGSCIKKIDETED